jgi:3-hydroxybutyryl-CoA dehydratase
MDSLIGESLDAWTQATDRWLTLSADFTRNVAAANRAAAAAFVPDTAVPDYDTPSVVYRREDWTVERSVDRREDLSVGDYVRFSKPVSDDDVHAFADASGDTNRLHLDDDFAAETRFGERIAHGTLVAGLVSAALARLPGLTIYLEQRVDYLGPVAVGERATAHCEIVEELGDDRYRLTTTVTDADGDTVVDGEAAVLVDELPENAGP